MHVDFKITTWERCELPDDLSPDQIKDLKRKIENGIITNWEDLDEEVGITHTEMLPESEEYMIPEENGGCATIELHLERGQTNPAASNSQE